MGRVRRFILTVRGNDLAINKKDKTMDEDFKFQCTTGALNTPHITIGNVSVVKFEDHCEVAIITNNGDLVHGRSVKFETARQFANAILAILDGAMYDEDAYDG
tara:strand:- start:627 stop:935 length:309 start_codon:yes stop_codon:yes gene_type:complete